MQSLRGWPFSIAALASSCSLVHPRRLGPSHCDRRQSPLCPLNASKGWIVGQDLCVNSVFVGFVFVCVCVLHARVCVH